ncbi:hypothetical protein [Longispora albida]|uniref:hypothetical protein n=1 Tax=Longispora albida TaxID=203523 RepID=UPI00037C0A3E|nr:hypothetical protein [Longispora albida]
MRANLLGTLAVLLVLLVMVVGLPVLNQAIPAERPVAVGAAIDIGHGVRLVPPPGAAMDTTRTLPKQGVLFLVLHGLDFRAEVKATSQSLEDSARRLRGRIQGQRGVQLAGDPREVVTASGVPGLRGAFSATGGDGLYAVYQRDNLAVQITVSGASLPDQVTAVETSMAGMVFP